MSRRSQGFTLLEILVVLVIISITISFAVLSVGLRSPASELEEHGKRIAALMQLASEEAILQGREMALQVGTHGYSFLVPGENDWRVIEDDQVFRQRELPEHVSISLSVEGSAADSRVYFFSSGEASPFSLVLSSADDSSARYELSGDSQAVIRHAAIQ